jgi:rhodanese-related sulfurtransferase
MADISTLIINQSTNMKKLFAVAAAVVLAVSVHAGDFADITMKDVQADAAAKSAVIIDANSPASYKSGHVPGALSFAAIKANLAASLPADKNALIIAYCGNPHCGAYLMAAKEAQKLGYTNIKHMPDGIDGWRAAKLPTEPGQ